ncbi:hypothetical protein EDD11_005283 [Mortierella claussenii]|nr:hypothetical protein EDD11_005283 [Mortierella claussenii]
MQHHPVICQHSVWGSKQQRFRHCKLPAKLTPALVDQIKLLEQECQILEESSNGRHQITEQDRRACYDSFLEKRSRLLQPELDAHRVLCGHHQKEIHAAEAAQELIEKEKALGTYQDPKEAKRLSKEQPVNPKDIPQELLFAIECVFSRDPSNCLKQVLDRWDGPEEWKMGRGRRGIGSDSSSATEANAQYPCHPSFTSMFSDAGVKKKRHLAQESQLIQAMVSRGLLKPVLEANATADNASAPPEAGSKAGGRKIGRTAVFIEFGAGTGGLSRHLQMALETVLASSLPSIHAAAAGQTEKSTKPLNFILLDRQKFRSRNQVDYMIRTQARPVKPRLLRITKDVRDLRVGNIQIIHEVIPGIAWPEWIEGGGDKEPQESSTEIPTHYICISKHFCGPATDLALSWMAPYLRELLSATYIKKRKRAESNQEKDFDINNDVESNGEDMGQCLDKQQHGISVEQLDKWIPWIIKLTGWATLGREEESCLVARPGKDATSIANETNDAALTRDQRRVLGKRCKKLLDMARCMYLIRECGFKEAKAIEYTEESVESGAIVGTM